MGHQDNMHCQVHQPFSFNWVVPENVYFPPTSQNITPVMFCHVLSTVDSDMTISLWKNRFPHSKNQFDERKQDWLEQKFRLWRLQKLDTIQAGPLCLLPDQEKASAKVQSCCLGQADFLPRQVTFKFTCPKGKGLSESSSNQTNYLRQARSVAGKAKCGAACPKDKLEFKFFPSPEGGR